MPDVGWEAEVRCAIHGDTAKPMDVLVTSLQLGIQVDGEHHFQPTGWQSMSDRKRKSKGKGTSQDQWDKDREMDVHVCDGHVVGVRGLVRLHYADNCESWRVCIMQAVELCKAAHVQGFVLYTPGYLRVDKVQL
jgi:hypothetical protein